VSDTTLRELERQFRSSGSVEDETAWLRERVRVGEVSQQKLELAAYFGHPAALEISDVPVAEVGEHSAGYLGRKYFAVLPVHPEGFAPLWPSAARHVGGSVQGSKRFGAEPLLRAGFALAAAIALDHPHPHPISTITGERRLLAAELALFEGHVLQEGVHSLVPAPVNRVLTTSWHSWDSQMQVSVAEAEAYYRRLVPSFVVAAAAAAVRERKLKAVTLMASWAGNWAATRYGLGPERAQRALQSELVPWALGYSDPVKNRVEARRQEAAESEP
jgi:hypothetical protein